VEISVSPFLLRFFSTHKRERERERMGSGGSTIHQIQSHPVDLVCDDMMSKMKDRLVPTLTRSFRRDLSETLISKKITFSRVTKIPFATVVVNAPQENVQLLADFLVRHLGCSSVSPDENTLKGATLVRPENYMGVIQLLPAVEDNVRESSSPQRSHSDALKHLYDPENSTGDVIQTKLDELFKYMYFKNHCGIAARDLTCIVSSLNENKIPFLGPYERGSTFIIMVPLPHTGIDTFIEVSSSQYEASIGRLKARPWNGVKTDVKKEENTSEKKVKKNKEENAKFKKNKKKKEEEVKKQEEEEEVKLNSAFNVGDKVMCRYQGFKKFFRATITKVNGDLTYDVRYEDGDTESNVKESHITIRADDGYGDNNDDNNKVEKDEKIKKKEEKKKIESKISSSSSESSDEETKAKEPDDDDDDDCGDNDDEQESKKPDDGREYSVGDRVRAKFNDGPDWYQGKIADYCSETKTYRILYDDGDEEYGVPSSRIAMG